MSGSARRTISIIDDDAHVCKAVCALVRSAGFRATTFCSAEEFLRSPDRVGTACIIADVEMPKLNGFELHATLVEEGDRIPIIFMTAYGDSNARVRALCVGAVELLEKPLDDNVLLDCIRTALGIPL
jgi:FixJ family two-component response regulator